MTHKHVFESYDPQRDEWVCQCGARAGRLGRVTGPYVNRPTGERVDPGVRSGRELLTC